MKTKWIIESKPQFPTSNLKSFKHQAPVIYLWKYTIQIALHKMYHIYDCHKNKTM